MMLTGEELLAGATARHQHDIPPEFLGGSGKSPQQVELRPLTVRDLQLIARAAKEDENLSAALMIQQALVSPVLKLEEVQSLPAGLARHLVERINSLSGVDLPQDALEEMVQAPLAKACFVLAREFGWTPEEVSGMTIGQILLYLEMGAHEAQAG
ncbi:hypothetical protein [Yoonia sediminilitoris]|uniref:Uncharacterized protein n=1 Tax=Yoonia sediminilitoris TaxID=1286148 RepID=A0A2T6KC16_9RHOB|nr:hypothetical protein [Yoonia sediminilitoris]PUB12412.1 hypothetical protein C8N45_11051 [Yoonia sediminilitoris]RCW93106.1 hypothetical protein DFP92_11051 [Yoonia sediminilitoris]